jgi:L-iditol 2-dehydrogenase
VDIDDAKLERAKSLGADEVFNSTNCDVAAEIAARTDGRGVDAALEAVGATDPIKTAMSCVRKGGTVTLIGNISPKVEVNLQAIVTRQIRLQGSCASSGEYPACIELLSRGAIRVDSMISAKSPLDEAASWFDRLYKHEPNLMKVIVQP